MEWLKDILLDKILKLKDKDIDPVRR